MLRSEKILPIRFYDDIFNQTRFTKRCNEICDASLLFPSNELPNFQIKREASLNVVSCFRLRNVCTDIDKGFYKVIPEGAQNMQSNTTFYDPLPEDAFIVDGIPGPAIPIVEFDCGKMKSIDFDPLHYTASGTYPQLTINTLECMTRFKIVVDKFEDNSGGFQIRVYDWGIATFYGINKPGAYIFEFAPSANIVVQFADFKPGDKFEISYMQAQIMDICCIDSDLRDVELDESKIKIIQLEDGTERLVYCGDDTNYNIPPGDYYYFVKCSGDRPGGGGSSPDVTDLEFYYSEVFTIKTPRDIEKFMCLKWYNSCDIESKIIYDSDTLDCEYQNKIFLNAGLFKPEYPTVREVEENGQGDETEVFKKWSKTKTIDLVCYEFLVDALSAVFIHDNVFLQKPLNDEELKTHREFKILNIEQEISPEFNDCQQKINMKFLLEKTFTNSKCCDGANLFGRGYKYEAHETCEDAYEGSGFILTLNDPPESGDGLLKCSTDQLVPVSESDVIFWHSTDLYYRLKRIDGIYNPVMVAPRITAVVTIAGKYRITGQLIPNTFGIIEYKVNVGDWHDTEKTAKADSEGNFEVEIPVSLDSGDYFYLRVHDISREEDFGYSQEFSV